MSAPYYADDRVALYHGDCREITDWLTANVLVTDPPYGRAWRQGQMVGTAARPGVSDAHAGIAGDASTAVRDAALEAWGNRLAVVFGDLMLEPPAGTKLTGVYRKPFDAGARGAIGGVRRDLEAIYLLGPWPSGIAGRSSVFATAASNVGNPSGIVARSGGHPHAKPLDLLEEIVSLCPPGAIADPFAGSGSTLVAARNLGRQAIGVEIDERYCEMAARRLAQDCLDLEATR